MVRERKDVELLAATLEAVHKLAGLDPGRLSTVLALARAYVSVYERPEEGDAVVASRLAQFGRPKASA